MAEGEASRPRGRVKIAIPEQYRAVNDEVWADLESYVFKGFLTSPSHLFGGTYVFKTLNHHELSYVRQFRPLRAAPMDVQATYRSYFIAYSMFIVNGENVLYRRPEHIRKLVETVAKIDPAMQDEIVANLAVLNERAARLHPLTEVYVHESRSRFRWMHAQGHPIHSTVNTGVPGTEELGMNYCQQAWTALNRMMDHREVAEYHWAHAKFIGSCWASKGVRAVEERDKARKEKDRSDLEDLKMKVLYRYLNRLSGKEEPEGLYQLPDGRMASVVKWHRGDDIDKLKEQLERAVNNEKDYHDLVIERKIRQFKEQAAGIADARRSAFKAPSLVGGKGETKVGGSSTVLAGGREEVEARLGRLKSLQRQQMQEYARKAEGESVRQAFDSGDPDKDRR